MTEAYLYWGLALLAVALLLIVVEVFVPSGGVLAVLAALVGIAGVIALFMHSTSWGLIGTLTLCIAAPAAFAFWVKVWPHTHFGRVMMGEKSLDQVEAERLAAEEERRKWLALVGKEGLAVTDLRPVGVIRIDGQRYDALAETTMITAGQKLKVTVVEGTQIKVRAIA